jgi:DNA-binding response OmpR family regulator/class 3 adenylate cyclase
MALRKRVLVVAEDTAVRAEIARMLLPAGYDVELACGEKRARELVSSSRRIEAAILASRWLEAPGLSFARHVRNAVGRLVMVAPRREEAERIARLLPEADDVLVEPLKDRELLDCLAPGPPAPLPFVIELEGCRVDAGAQMFVDGTGRQVPLTRAEFELLAALARSQGRVLSRDQLRHAVASRGAGPHDRSIDMLVTRLRRKIEPDPKSPRFVLTAPGVGYRFAVRRTSERATAARFTQRVAERRQVAIVAGQFVGLAALASRTDPEDLREVLARVEAICRKVLSRHAGLPAKLEGDALLAYFGCPKARDNDAERAVQAALDLVREIAGVQFGSARLTPRLGIATGTVVIGVAHDVRERAAVGEPVTLALSLQAAAAPGTVMVASHTRNLVRDVFECIAAEPVMLDGAAVVPAWRVIGARERRRMLA